MYGVRYVQVRVVLSTIVQVLALICPRNKARDAGHQPPVLEVQDEDGFERKQEIKKLGFNDQILIVSSTLLGETTSDTNSFTLKLTQAFRWSIGHQT